MFTDRVTLSLIAGKGGNGAVAWRREKFIPKGGPAGGDGGHGGSVTLIADSEVLSLEDYRNKRILKAQNGQMGGGNNCKGKNGQDLTLKIPMGTLVKDVASGELLHDFTENGQSWTICAGGKGGKGNTRFKSSTNQAPLQFTEGTEGETKEVELELKLIADVGFVGMPNAGKSTLISRLANIRVKIAPYPFTTLKPNLGVVFCEKGARLLIADIPGIIKNAHENRGLGFEFLRHVERCPVLVFLIELSPWEESRDAFEEFSMLRKELEAYNPELLKKPFLVVLNKIDIEGADGLARKFKEKCSNAVFEISAQDGTGCETLKSTIYSLVQKTKSDIHD